VIRTYDLKPGTSTFEVSDMGRDFSTTPPRIWCAAPNGKIYGFSQETDPTSPN
jgi:hypothetical protein